VGVNEVVNFTPRGQISPLGAKFTPGVKFTPGGEVKNGPLFSAGGWCYDHNDRDGRRSLVVNVDAYDVASDVWSVETQVPISASPISGVTLSA
jgi:hypothetical protein